MKSLIIAIAVSFAAAGSAWAQSFNIDFNVTSNAAGTGGAGVPASTFGGAADQAGTWNNITSASANPTTLVGLNGAASSVTLQRGSSSFFSTSNSFTSGDFEKLMDDVQRADSGTLTYTFSGLQTGLYAVYTYGIDPGNCMPSQCVGQMTGAAGTIQQVLSCNLGVGHTNEFKRGGTHSLHLYSLVFGSGFSVSVAPDFGPAACGGIQVVHLSGRGVSRHRIYVNDNAAGDNLGTSWADAYTDLQVALAEAVAAGPQFVEIWTASGFYYPHATDENVSFVIPSGLQLYGGFAGTETSLSQRTSPAFYITAMTGGISGQHSYTVVKADNTSTSTLVDGFSIANGNNNGGGSSDGHGGGLRVVNGSPMFRNCKFLSNIASTEGGAVYSTGGSPTFVNCLFYNNDCNNGAGGAVYHHTTGDIDFYNCTFDRNHSFNGGAIEISFASGDIYNCWFNGNTSSDDAGAIYIAGAALLTRIGNCTITNNSAANEGGGVKINAGVNSPYNVAMSNCIVWGNTDGVPNTLTAGNVLTSGSGSFTLSYSTVEGGVAGFSGTGSNGTSPGFVDMNGADNVAGNSDDNVHLTQSSAMNDSGSNTLVLNDVPDLNSNNNTSEKLPLDLDGQARFFNNPGVVDSGVGSAPVVDRGCFEFNLQAGDLDCNNSVNTLDVDDFVQAELNPAAYTAAHPLCTITLADMNGDGLIDALDIQLFVNCVILGQCP